MTGGDLPDCGQQPYNKKCITTIAVTTSNSTNSPLDTVMNEIIFQVAITLDVVIVIGFFVLLRLKVMKGGEITADNIVSIGLLVIKETENREGEDERKMEPPEFKPPVGCPIHNLDSVAIVDVNVILSK